MDRAIRNVLIERTMLGHEDHGIFTCSLQTISGAIGQSFGGYALDSWSEEKKARIGTAYGVQFLINVLRVCGVEKWEDIKGKHIRVDADHGRVFRIGHITEDIWFDPKQLAEEMGL